MKLIEDYIVYLITECGLSVSLHPLEKESLITFSALMRFNIHDNSYCTCIKSSAAGRERCHLQQEKVMAVCRKGGERFCGICHAGVLEYVYPIFDGCRTVGFISVSGYASDAGRERMHAAAERFGVSDEVAKRAYATLGTALPPEKKLDVLLLPLCRMLELAYQKRSAREECEASEAPIYGMLRYIQQNHAMDLTSEEICRAFYCSRSHFSHLFKKETGKSFREYLTDVRMEDAKTLLRYSKLSVTQIALAVGFGDPNYFSSVFKKREKLSPQAYRKAVRE